MSIHDQKDKTFICWQTDLLTILLQVLFVGLKLGGVITWSWWWVLSPIWGSGVLALLVIFLFTLLLVVPEQLAKQRLRRKA